MAVTVRDDKKSNRDGRIENPRDDPRSSSTKPATSSPHNSPDNDGDSDGQRPLNTPHETSTPVISGSSAPPASDGGGDASAVIAPTSTITQKAVASIGGDASAVIAPPSTITQKTVASITIIWDFLHSLWKNRVIHLIFTAAYSYLFYKLSPMNRDPLSTMTMFLLFNWVLLSLYKNMGSIFLMTIGILWLLWLVYATLVHFIIVEVVRSIYLTSTKARLWLLIVQTLKVMFVDFAIFLGSIIGVPFDYMRFRLINGLISRFGQGPAQLQLLPEDMLVPT